MPVQTTTSRLRVYLQVIWRKVQTWLLPTRLGLYVICRAQTRTVRRTWHCPLHRSPTQRQHRRRLIRVCPLSLGLHSRQPRLHQRHPRLRHLCQRRRYRHHTRPHLLHPHQPHRRLHQRRLRLRHLCRRMHLHLFHSHQLHPRQYHGKTTTLNTMRLWVSGLDLVLDCQR